MMFKTAVQSLQVAALLAFSTLSSHALESGRYFQAITTQGVIGKNLWYELDGEKVEIYANNTLRSLDYEYELVPNIVFYGDRVNSEGEPIPEAVASLPYSIEDLATKADRLLLIFHKLDNSGQRGPSYQILVMEDQLDSFPLGSFKFVNFTDAQIAVILGNENFLLKTRDQKIIAVSPPEKGDLTIQLAANKEDGEWERFYSNGWGHSADLRTIVFLTKLGNTIKPLRYRQYDR